MVQDDTVTLNKYGFIETVHLSTHKICFGREIRKLFFGTHKKSERSCIYSL